MNGRRNGRVCSGSSGVGVSGPGLLPALVSQVSLVQSRLRIHITEAELDSRTTARQTSQACVILASAPSQKERWASLRSREPSGHLWAAFLRLLHVFTSGVGPSDQVVS